MNIVKIMQNHCRAHNGMCRDLANELCEFAYLHRDGEAECTIKNPLEWGAPKNAESTEKADKKRMVAKAQICPECDSGIIRSTFGEPDIWCKRCKGSGKLGHV